MLFLVRLLREGQDAAGRSIPSGEMVNRRIVVSRCPHRHVAHPARSNPAACDLLAGESLGRDGIRHGRTRPTRRVMGNRKDFTADGWHLCTTEKEPAFSEHAPYPVDDNQDAADTVRVLVKRWGYDCRVTYDGFACQKAAQSTALTACCSTSACRDWTDTPQAGEGATRAWAGACRHDCHSGDGAGVAGTGPRFSSPRVAWNRPGVVEGHTGRAVPCTASLAGRRAQASSVCRSRAGSFPNSRDG